MLLVDTGNSYQGLCSLINARTRGEDGIYVTYKEDDPVSFNPFYTDTGEFDVEKRESIKTLILTLWKREDEPPRRSEEVALSGAVNAYIRRITENPQTGDFNGFYEFVRDEYRNIIKEKNVREKDFDIDGFLNVLEPFYQGGRLRLPGSTPTRGSTSRQNASSSSSLTTSPTTRCCCRW